MSTRIVKKETIDKIVYLYSLIEHKIHKKEIGESLLLDNHKSFNIRNRNNKSDVNTVKVCEWINYIYE